jgi:hypothetical protein
MHDAAKHKCDDPIRCVTYPYDSRSVMGIRSYFLFTTIPALSAPRNCMCDVTLGSTGIFLTPANLSTASCAILRYVVHFPPKIDTMSVLDTSTTCCMPAHVITHSSNMRDGVKSEAHVAYLARNLRCCLASIRKRRILYQGSHTTPRGLDILSRHLTVKIPVALLDDELDILCRGCGCHCNVTGSIRCPTNGHACRGHTGITHSGSTSTRYHVYSSTRLPMARRITPVHLVFLE